MYQERWLIDVFIWDINTSCRWMKGVLVVFGLVGVNCGKKIINLLQAQEAVEIINVVFNLVNMISCGRLWVCGGGCGCCGCLRWGLIEVIHNISIAFIPETHVIVIKMML